MVRLRSRSIIAATLLVAANAWADAPAEPAVGAQGLHPLRLVPLAGALAAGTWQLSASTGFGRSSGVVADGHSHMRLASSLSLARWFAHGFGVGLSLDGRYDRHTGLPGGARDDGWTGDPRVFVRYGHTVGSRVDVGALASVWLPGRDAPSVPLDAVTPEVSGLVTVWTDAGVGFGGRLGFRWDRSARAAPDPARIGPGDRASLGASDASAALLGVSASLRRERWGAFVEGAWDLLIGTDAPPTSESPLRVTAGIDVPVHSAVALVAGAGYTLSRHAAYARGVAGAPLVAIPPDLVVNVGVLARWGGAAPPPPPPPTPPEELTKEPPAAPAPPPPAEPAAKIAGQLRGTVVSPSGRKLDGTLALTRVDANATDATPRSEPFAKGVFRIDLEAGEYELVVEVRGHASQRRKIAVEVDGVTVLNLVLAPSGERRR